MKKWTVFVSVSMEMDGETEQDVNATAMKYIEHGLALYKEVGAVENVLMVADIPTEEAS